MNLKAAFQDSERAVSPVIGVILMVAITVILAAVIGTFVLGLGDSLSDSTPQAQLNVENVNTGSPANVTISHRGGDELQGEDLRINIGGNDVDDSEVPGSLAVGEEATIESSDVADGATLRIIHVPSDSIIFEETL